MERKSFGFSLSKFMPQKNSPETNCETAASPTSALNPFPNKPSQHSTTFETNSETGELAFHGPQIGARLPLFFNSALSSSTDRPSSRFFSPVSKTVEEYPFTPSRNSINSIDDGTKSSITPMTSPSPRVPSHPVSYESSGELEELVIHRQHISTGLPSFFQRPSSSATEFPFTPRRKQIVAEISPKTPSSGSSPIGYAGSNVIPLSTPSRFQGNRFLQITNRRSERNLPTETQDHQFENDSEAAEGSNRSEHSTFYRCQLNETVDSEKQYLEEGERNIDSTWTDGPSSQEKISFESQVQLITKQFLEAAANNQINVKAENTSLKKELSRSQKQILDFEAQFDELKKNQSEAIKRANDLLFEKETLRKHIENMQEQVSTLEEQLEQKQGQFEEVNSQLEDKEQRLKAALEHISALEELLRSSDERLSALQTQLQLVLTEREAADEKVNALSGQVNSLQENLFSLELTMSNAENNFHSALKDYKDQQEKLADELVNYQNTESALRKACTDFETVKEELGCCTNELIKTQADSKVLAKEKLELEEHVSRLSEKYSSCEQSLCVALEDISLLESTRSTLQAEIEQLKHHLETSSTELSATGEKVSIFREENEMLHSQLDSLRKNFDDSEEKYRLSSTKIQQELDCERAGHTETKMSAMKVLTDTKNALEFQVNELQENLLVIERQKESIKQKLESELMAHSETKSHLKVCKNQLEGDRNQHLLESSKVQNAANILKDEKNALTADINEIRGNLVAVFSQNESIKKELNDEKTAHNETKSHLKNCEQQLENDKNSFSVELCKIQSAMQKLSYQNKFLEDQVRDLKENVDEAERQNETIKQELSCERTAHHETKSNWKLCKNHLEDDQNEQSVEISKLQSAVQIMNDQKIFMEAQVSDLQCKLVAAGRNYEAIREKHLSLERQLEFSAIEISTLKVEGQEQFNRNNELQALLDDIQMTSALSEDNLKAALSKSHKELDSQKETLQETIRNLTEARFQLRSSENICSEALLDRTRLQTDITNFLNEKLKIEEIVQRLERTITAQEENINAVTQDNLKLKKDKMEIEEIVKHLERKLSFQEQNLAALISDNVSLKRTLGAYEEYIKITHQKCQLVFNENFGAVTNAKNLSTEMKMLNEKFETIRKNAEFVDEDCKDFNVSLEKFIETKTAFFMEIRERLEETQLCLASSNEALQRATMEKTSLENEVCGLRAEKNELEKKIKTFTESSFTSESIQEKLRSRNAVLETMKSSASQQILDLQNRVNSADAELTSSNVKVQELAKEKASLENQLGSLRRQLQASHDESGNTFRMLISEKEELEKKIEGFIETTANWKTIHEDICNRNSALNSLVESSKQHISDLRQRIHTLENELDLSNEKVSDLLVDKTNLESQLGSLRHQLQVCQDKSNRDLEKLRNQLETERASHEDYKSRLAITRTSHQECKELTIEIKKECPKVVSKLSKRSLNDNKISNSQRKEMIPTPSRMTNEEFQRQPLSDSGQQLETGKTNKNQSNSSENSSSEFDLANRFKDNTKATSKAKELDKHDGKKLSKNEENKPVEIIEESPPPPSRKALPRRASVAAKQSLSVQINYEHSSSSTSTSSSEQRAAETSDEVAIIPVRKKLFLAPSPPYPFPTPSPVSEDPKVVHKNSMSSKADIAAHEESQQSNPNDSFVETPFPPTRKTYVRKRLSMTSRLGEKNPLSTQQSSKRSRKTYK